MYFAAQFGHKHSEFHPYALLLASFSGNSVYLITLIASKSGCEYEFRVIKGNDIFTDKLTKVYKYCYKTDKDYLIFLAETIGGKITVEYRKKNKYDSIKYRINEKE